MRVGLVGPSYQERSLPFDAQRTVNLFPVLDETKNGKEVSALYGTPGLSLFSTCGEGSIRGVFCAANGRAFVVSGITLYEVTSDGTATSRGAMSSGSSVVTMDENGTQLAICDGSTVYIFTYATNAFAVVGDIDIPSSGTLCFIDGYFVVSKNSSGAFYISSLYDGNTWDPLDFATAESSPDNLIRVINAGGNLWLLGNNTIEIWTNIGGSGFPFERINNAKMDMGCLAAHSVVTVGNSIVWLGRDKKGSGVVYSAQGISPQRISTHAIEYKIQQASNPSALRGYSYQQDGHVFYVLTGLDTTLVYDFTTELWHERAYLNPQGVYEAHLGLCHMFAFDMHLVGDRSSGKVYEMSLDVYSDNGSAIKRMRVFTHIGEEGKRFTINSLQVDFERGVGLTTGQGSAPVAALRMSKDGGRSWSNEYQASIGAIGVRLPRTRWNRLGQYELATIEISITDPVKVAICGAYIT